MAPWPEQGNEPKAPDKSCSKSSDSSLSESCKVTSGTTEVLEVTATGNKAEDKQVRIYFLPYFVAHFRKIDFSSPWQFSVLSNNSFCFEV
jgi:hypothetical protein